MNRYLNWLRQADNDILWAEHSIQDGVFAQACFIAQQAGEKALKALCFFRGHDIVRTHSLFQIVRALEENGSLEQNARELDLYYIAGRYPDAFPAGAPFEILTPRHTERAISAAREILEIILERVHAT